MSEIIIHDDEDFERALRRFERSCKSSERRERRASMASCEAPRNRSVG